MSFRKGDNIAVSDDPYKGEGVNPHHGKTGTIVVSPELASAEGFEKSGRLKYKNSRYLYTEVGEPFFEVWNQFS